ncbi:MAG: transcriptional regulator [Gammaproteobacteria bacterium]|nr:MAG: transcriptional regulator [Gammaproteobacteria bacterium]
MDRTRALAALGALAQGTRLDAFRSLVQAGPRGLPAGELAVALGITPPALSFHLRGLADAGLVHARQDGRFVWYRADLAAMHGLVGFLSENCCGGEPCLPVRRPARKRA